MHLVQLHLIIHWFDMLSCCVGEFDLFLPMLDQVCEFAEPSCFLNRLNSTLLYFAVESWHYTNKSTLNGETSVLNFIHSH